MDAQLGNTDPDCMRRDGRIVEFPEALRALEQEHPNGTLTVAPVV
jgi:hypothetical protein